MIPVKLMIQIIARSKAASTANILYLAFITYLKILQGWEKVF